MYVGRMVKKLWVLC